VGIAEVFKAGHIPFTLLLSVIHAISVQILSCNYWYCL